MSERLVLVVDNEAQTVNLISGTLEPLGYTVVSAASGDQGLAKAKERAPSLILLNLAVPNTDGLRICKAFMSITDTPIILLTMREGKYDSRYKAQYGIVDFMRKPLSAKEVAEKASEHATFIGTTPVVEEEPESVPVDAFEIPEEEPESVPVDAFEIPEEEPESVSVDAFETPEEEVEPVSVDAFEIPEEEVESVSVDAFEIPEEEVPSSNELEASIASYAEGEETLTPVEEDAEVEEAIEVAPEEDVMEAGEAIEVISEDEIPEVVVEAEETGAEVEAPAEETEIPQWPAAEEEAPTKAVPAPEWPTVEEAPAEEKLAPGWSIPEKKPLGEVPEWPAAEEEVPAEETVPEWSLPEEEAFLEPEAPTAEDMDWSSLSEETAAPEDNVLEQPEVPPTMELEAKEFFEDETPPAKDEPTHYEGDITYPGEETEYEIRPAALERHKRRKSKTRIFIPVLAILLVCAIAGGLFFFFISGKGKVPQLFAPKPSAPVVKKAQPTPPPTEKAPPPAEPTSPPAAKAPPSVESQPVAPAATDGKVYYVQFGAFRSKDNAKNFQVEIKELGYDTFILEGRLKGQSIYLVLLSDKFTDKWNAFKQAKQIKNDANIGTSVHSE